MMQNLPRSALVLGIILEEEKTLHSGFGCSYIEINSENDVIQ